MFTVSGPTCMEPAVVVLTSVVMAVVEVLQLWLQLSEGSTSVVTAVLEVHKCGFGCRGCSTSVAPAVGDVPQKWLRLSGRFRKCG